MNRNFGHAQIPAQTHTHLGGFDVDSWHPLGPNGHAEQPNPHPSGPDGARID